MNELDGKVAIVTGAASGIGLATVQLFLEEGAFVIGADVATAGGDFPTGDKVRYKQADVSNEADIRELIESAVESFGRLDVLFNNAGIEGEQAPTSEATLENWDHVIAVNLRGVFLGMKYAIRAMRNTGGGAIINNASVAGLVGFAGIPAYCASKGGVIQLTKTAALECATEGIRVNCLCPGVIDTAMVERFLHDSAEARKQFASMEPVGRFGTAREVAQLALFLASDRSSFMTGAIVPVDGGFVAR